MYTIKSSNLKHPHHYVANDSTLLKSLVEAAFILSNQGNNTYLNQLEETLSFDILHLSTEAVYEHQITLSSESYEQARLLTLIQTITCSGLEKEDRITIKDQFKALMDQLEECTELDDIHHLAPSMLVTLIQYAHLINQPYQAIQLPPDSMTLSLFTMRMGYISHVNTHFTELIDYFIDFCDYCFDLNADDLLKLTLQTLLDSHLAYGELLSTKIS